MGRADVEHDGAVGPGDLAQASDLAEAVSQADVVVMGVPSQAFRSTLEEVSDHLRAWVPIVSLTKGLEQGSRLRMSEVANQVVPGHPVAVLTGPNLAKEILAGDAAASVIATHDPVVQRQRCAQCPHGAAAGLP